jgi:uncharacterized repeat protein (TIGR03803 family)
VTIVYNFDGTEGYGYAPLVQDGEGYLYGTADGGTLGGGIVFKVSTHGKFTVLHNFTNQDYNHGSVPVAGLVLATNGKLYGSAYRGGPQNGGSLFDINTTGQYREFYIFDGTDGSGPQTTAMQHTNGKIYGMTSEGGAYGGGVIYCVDAGLPPFVRLVFTAGKVGRSIGILGQRFKGTTSVSFNGTGAAFRVVSDTYLVATVPPGATTGFVTVTTPKGILGSNMKFQVEN